MCERGKRGREGHGWWHRVKVELVSQPASQPDRQWDWANRLRELRTAAAGPGQLALRSRRGKGA
uniref:Uncharacterized protein n=1 Tax=Physcomitrium patens TaxID=3218 RepID=A0A2K1L8V4_PHYPA|nr:hypothetical protein PHYPA_000877 [Physcomitrium patens]